MEYTKHASRTIASVQGALRRVTRGYLWAPLAAWGLLLGSPAVGHGQPIGPEPNIPDDFVPVLPWCARVASSVNGAKGDILLTEASDGPIRAILQSVGQRFTHSGMLLSSGRVRHNTMEVERVAVDTSNLRLNPNHLQNGRPGTVTQGIDRAFFGDVNNFGQFISSTREFFAGRTTILAGNNNLPSGAKGFRTKAADRIASMDGNYRLFAYTNMNWRDPFRRSNNDGNHCSGTIFHALDRADAPGIGLFDYTAQQRDQAAPVLFENIRSKVRNEDLGFWGSLANVFTGITSTAHTRMARNVGNQVVNCMAFNRCSDLGSGWKNGVGSGSAVSPQDLQTTLQLGILVRQQRGDKGDLFPYNVVKPAQITEAHYDCSCVNGVGANGQACPL